MRLHSFVFQVLPAVTLYQTTVAASWRTTTKHPSPTISVVQHIANAPNLENLAVRRHGQVLVTSISSSSIYQISPGNQNSPALVARVPGVTSLLGITELESDVFYINGANLTGFNIVPSSSTVFKLDMRPFSDGAARLSLVTKIPEAGLLNGISRLSWHDTSSLFLADSVSGVVLKINVHTGKYEIALEDPTLSITKEGIPIGVNGIVTHRDTLFFTNTNQGLFAKVPISLSTGLAIGPVDIIIDGTLVANDDFVRKEGMDCQQWAKYYHRG
ncbi:hypothetical protein CEP54_010114 [Fusarium duplospermum]|uniref:SMP-30/Gluconolactonase/LRE-like region domain-containing protein n=1 Tax=Fusarium duplospermum TaxID=1325734 RepID=A0A428PLU4_9HYPO|nr:hypothetical protein CEP54_010114 [Fusarium duplospermum]